MNKLELIGKSFIKEELEKEFKLLVEFCKTQKNYLIKDTYMPETRIKESLTLENKELIEYLQDNLGYYLPYENTLDYWIENIRTLVTLKYISMENMTAISI